jgi:hypothetical protein
MHEIPVEQRPRLPENGATLGGPVESGIARPVADAEFALESARVR